MPYIPKERRSKIYKDNDGMDNTGELNYKLTTVLIDYLEEHDLYYDTINDIIGALEGVKLEFYRRVAVPYEEQKIVINGDVYSDYFTGSDTL